MDKAIFIVLDACQYEAGTRNLGYLEHLIDYHKGAKYKVRGELPSLSRPMYATLLTGLPACRHGIAANETVRTLQCESVFSLCKAAGGTTAAAAYYWFSELFLHAPFRPEADRIQLNTGGMIDAGIFYWDDYYPDSHLLADGEYLRRACDPDFILYHPMGIDTQGHLHGSGSRGYEEAIIKMGTLLSLSFPVWLEEGWQVVVTADHGMNGLGLHGGTDDVQRDTPLYVFSGRVKSGRYEESYIPELAVAPLLCYLLGIPAGKDMMDLSTVAGIPLDTVPKRDDRR